MNRPLESSRTFAAEVFLQPRTTETAGRLAASLVQNGAVPKISAEDALHIAVAAVHGVDYLLTWNCKHIANATLRQAIEAVCRTAGYEPPVICTPEELVDDKQV